MKYYCKHTGGAKSRPGVPRWPSGLGAGVVTAVALVTTVVWGQALAWEFCMLWAWPKRGGGGKINHIKCW